MALTQVSSGLISSVANTAITGNIISSQITSVANTQVTGLITSSQIASVANTQITGLITAGQIANVANTQITGLITSGQIATVANTQVTGLITSAQIASVANTQITGNIAGSQIAPTAVTPGTYGATTQHAVITVDQQGRITAASNATPSIANNQITGIITTSQGGTGTSSWTAGTNYVAPGTATTFTATQTFSGSSSTFGAILQNAAETANLVATAVNSAATAYMSNGAVQYYTTAAGATWVQNITYSSGTTMNAILSVGQSATIAVLVTQGSSGASYYPTAVNIDGSTTGVTTYWQGGSAPTKGYASGIDVYTYTIIKTAATPTYTVLATQTQF